MYRTHLLALGFAVAVAGVANANLVVNGGFEAGSVSFTSNYNDVTVSGDPSNSLVPEKTFAVDYSPALRHPAFGDYAPFDGEKQLIVNGVNGVTPVWKQTLTFGSAGTFTFSVQTRAAYEPAPGPAISPAQLKLRVGGNDISPVPFAVDSTVAWEEWSQSFTVAAAGSYLVEIVNTNDEAFGNDFSLDNIEVVPEPATLLALGLGVSAFVARRRRK